MNPPVHIESSEAANSSQPARLVCRECGYAHTPVALVPGETALCVRCNSILAKKGWFGKDAGLAFTVTGLLLIPPSMLLSFVTVSKLGDEQASLLFTGGRALWQNGMPLLAVWVLLCGGLAPIFLLCSLAAVLLPVRLGWPPVEMQRFLWVARAVAYWAIPEVQILAVLVGLAKLGHVVRVTLGPGFWCYAALAVVTMLAWRSFELEAPAGPEPNPRNLQGLDLKRRPFVPGSQSLTRAAALGVAAAIMLVPANLIPIIYTQNAGKIRTDTIFTGIVGLCQHGWWILGVIVFIASILIPLLKLAGLGWLWLVARRGPDERARPLTRLYVVLCVIGRWSMLDVFLVAFLTGVVQFGYLAKVEPRSGIVAFAAAVVLTVLATEAFDPRALWERPAILPSSTT
jgi:paraquat-inducible protein A